MKINLYDKNGYINIKSLMEKYNPTMLIMVGGRGIGKTYGVLKYLLQKKEKFILARRTVSEREFIRQLEFNPLYKLYLDGAIPGFIIDGGKYSDTYYYENENEKFAYCISIATSAKIRGMNGEEIKYIYYDEFIKDNNEHGLKDEAGGLFQLVETIGRNREIEGKEPLKIILTANSNNIFNPICDILKLTDIFIDMRKNNQEVRFLKNKGILLCDIRKSPISEKKKDTFLYKLTKGTEFYNMAIANEYYNNFNDYIGTPYPLREYKPFIAVNNIHILRHSSNRILYVTRKNRGIEKIKFKRWDDFLKEYAIFLTKCFRIGCVFFESGEIASYFKDFI